MTGYRIAQDAAIVNGNANFYALASEMRLQVFLPQTVLTGQSPGSFGQRAPLPAPAADGTGVPAATGACAGALTGVYFVAERWGAIADFTSLAVDFAVWDVPAGPVFGLVWAFRDPLNYYAAVQRAKAGGESCTGVYRVVNGVATALGSTTSGTFTPSTASLRVNNRLTVTKSGAAISVWSTAGGVVPGVGATPLLSVTDPAPSALAPGNVGVFGSAVQTAAFDNLQVQETPSCSDGVRNGDEDGIDCGGSACALPCANPVVTTKLWNTTSGVAPTLVGWHRETWGTASGTPSWATVATTGYLTQRTNTGLAFLGGPGGNSDNWMGGAFWLCNACGKSVDSDIEVYVQPIDNDWIGVVTQFSDRDNMYQFNTRQEVQSTAIHRRRGGANTVLSLDVIRATYTPGQWCTMRMRTVGGRVTVWFNGLLWFDAQDPLPLLTAGYAGIFITNQDNAWWSRATVKSYRPVNALCVTSYPLRSVPLALGLDGGATLPTTVGAYIGSWHGSAPSGVDFYQSPYYTVATAQPVSAVGARGAIGASFTGGQYLFSLARYETDISAGGFGLFVVLTPTLNAANAGTVIGKGGLRGLPGWSLTTPRSATPAFTFTVTAALGAVDGSASISTVLPGPYTGDILVLFIGSTPTGGGTQVLSGTVNGVPFTNATADPSFTGTVSGAGSTAYTFLGTQDDGTNGYRGIIFEVAAYGSAVAPADAAAVTARLMTKYGIAGRCPALPASLSSLQLSGANGTDATVNASVALTPATCGAAGAVTGAVCTLGCAPGFKATAGVPSLTCSGGAWNAPTPLLCERPCAPVTGNNTARGGCTQQLVAERFGDAPAAFNLSIAPNSSAVLRGFAGAPNATLPPGWEVQPARYANMYSMGGVLVGDAVCADGISPGFALGTIALVSSPAWRGAAAALTVRVSAWVLTDTAVTLYARFSDVNNYIGLTLDTVAGTYTIAGAAGGAAVSICASPPAGGPNAPGTPGGVPLPSPFRWYALSMDIGPDGSITGSVNGQAICLAINTAVTSGSAGVGMPQGANILVDDFIVSSVDPVCAGGCGNLTAGRSCALSCTPGLVPVSGTPVRTCALDGSLSGSPLVCGVPPPSVANASVTTPELQPAGTLVGIVNGSMALGTPGALLYEFVSGNDGAAFVIEACSGEVRVNNPAAIDYEALNGAENRFMLGVRAYIAGSSPVSAAFGFMTVIVTDANDPPVITVTPGGSGFLGPAACTVPEGSAIGTPVCNLTIFDPDSLNAVSAFAPTTYALTVTIAYGNAGAFFGLQQAPPRVLVIAPGLDVNTAASYTMSIRATDARDPLSFGAATLAIALSRINHPPVFVGPAYIEVDETDVAAGFVLSPPLSASDPDAGDTHVFSVLPSPALALWPGDNASLVFTASRAYAASGSYIRDGRLIQDYITANVTVTDAGGLLAHGAVAVYVLANISSLAPVVRSLAVLAGDAASGAGTFSLGAGSSSGGGGGNLLNTDGSDALLFGCSNMPAGGGGGTYVLSANRTSPGLGAPAPWSSPCVYSPPGDDSLSALGVNGMLTCSSSPGFGTGWTFVIVATPPSGGPGVRAPLPASIAMAASYAPPKITGVTPGGEMLTSGGTPVSLTGYNFGGPTAPVSALYGPCSSSLSSCNLMYVGTVGAVGHTAMSITTGPGVGGNLLIQLSVGGQIVLSSPSVTLSYAPPVVTAAARPGSNVSVLLLSGGGSERVQFTGRNFGAAGSGPTLAYGPYAPPVGGAWPPLPFVSPTACTYPSPASSHTLIECTTAPGLGTALVLSVTVAGLSGTPNPAGVLLGFAPPVLTGIAGAGSRDLDTRGGQALQLSVLNTGPAAFTTPGGLSAVFGPPIVTYGPASNVSKYVAQGCAVADDGGTGSGGSVDCVTVEGAGGVGGFFFSVSLGGQTSAPTLTSAKYAPPVITGFDEDPLASPGSIDASTRGGQTVVIQGKNFGPDASDISVEYDAEVHTGGHGGPVLTRLRFVPPGPCVLPPPGHTTLICTTSAGAGGLLNWLVVVANQTSTTPSTNYAPPSVANVSASAGVSGGPRLTGVSTQGGLTVTVSGSGFGPPASYASPGGGPLLQWLSYGPSDAPYSPTSVTVLSDTTLAAVLAPGIGSGLRFAVSVADQVSPMSPPGAGSFDFAPPSIVSLSQSTSPTVGGGTVTVTGTNWGLLDGSSDQALTLGGVAVPITLRYPSLARVQAGNLTGDELNEGSYYVQFNIPPGVGAALPLVITCFRRSSPSNRVSSSPAADGPAVLFSYATPAIILVTVDRLSDPAVIAFLNASGVLAAGGLDPSSARLLTVSCANAGPSASSGAMLQVASTASPSTWLSGGTSLIPVSWSHTRITAVTSVTTGTLRIAAAGGDGDPSSAVYSNVVQYGDVSPYASSLGGARLLNFSTAGGDLVLLGVDNIVLATTAVSVTVGDLPAVIVDASGAPVAPSAVPASIIAAQVAAAPPGVDLSLLVITLRVLLPPGQGSSSPITITRDGISGSSAVVSVGYASPSLSAITVGDAGSNSSDSVLVFAPGVGSGLWPVVRVPAAGGVVTFLGSNLGVCPIVRFGSLRGAACAGDVQPSDSLAVISHNHSSVSMGVPPGEGAGGGGWTLSLSAGDQAVSVSAAYRAPAVTRTYGASGGALPSSGGATVVIEGSGFGQLGTPAPGVSVLFTSAGPEGGGPASAPCVGVSRDPLAPDHRLSCTLPPGQGANLTLSILVADQVGISAGVLSYDAPSIGALASLPAGAGSGSSSGDGGGNGSSTSPSSPVPDASAFTGGAGGNTTGGYLVRISGGGFGDRAAGCVFVTYTRSASLRCNGLADSFSEGEVAPRSVLSWSDAAIVFVMPESPGSVAYVVVSAGGQPSAPSPAAAEVWTFTRPALLYMDPPSLSTAGGEVCTVYGTNLGFGPNRTSNAVRVTGAAAVATGGNVFGYAPVSFPAPLPLPGSDSGLPEDVGLRVNFFTAARCITSSVVDEANTRHPGVANCHSDATDMGGGVLEHTHDHIVFVTLPGVGLGQNLTFSLINLAGGIVDSTALSVSYAPPIVDRIEPSQLQLGGISTIFTPASANGSSSSAVPPTLITVYGRNFGSGDATGYTPEQLALSVVIGGDVDGGGSSSAPDGGALAAGVRVPCTSPARVTGASGTVTLQCLLDTSALTVGFKSVSVIVAGQANVPSASSPLLQVVCASGFYGRVGEVCLPCILGATCSGYTYIVGGGSGATAPSNVTLLNGQSVTECNACYGQPIAQPGWYNMLGYTDANGHSNGRCPPERVSEGRTPAQCDLIVACEPPGACLGNNVCAAGYVSDAWPYRCAQCDAHFFSQGGLCKACPAVPQLTIVFLFVAAIIAIGVGYTMNAKGVSSAYLTLGLDFFQTIAIMGETRVAWPDAMNGLFGVYSAFNLQIEVLELECTIPGATYLVKWGVVMALPLAVGLILCTVHGAVVGYTVLVLGQPLRKAAAHAAPLIAMGQVLMYFLYLNLARTDFDVFTCRTTVPPDYDSSGNEVTYMAGVMEQCGIAGGTQMKLIPWAVVVLFVYTLGYPCALALNLWRNRELIMEDQLLRAKGVGDDRLTNPHAYEFRRRFSRTYYQFKPDAFGWVLAILLRKFLIAISSLIFSQNPTFALSAITLVLFGAYAAQVRLQPYMNVSEYDDVLASHTELVRMGNPVHSRLAAALAGIETRGRKRTKIVGFSREGLDALRTLAMRPGQVAALAGRAMYNLNNVESTLIAAAMCVSVLGVLFTTAAASGDSASSSFYAASRQGVLGVELAIIIGASLYWLVVLCADVYGLALAARARKLAIAQLAGRRGSSSSKLAGVADASSPSGSSRRLIVGPKGSALLGSGPASVSDVAESTAFNPLFISANGSGVSSSAAAEGLSLDVVKSMERVPDEMVWRAIRDRYVAAMGQTEALAAELAGVKRDLAKASDGEGREADPSSRQSTGGGLRAAATARRNNFGPVASANAAAAGAASPSSRRL